MKFSKLFFYLLIPSAFFACNNDEEGGKTARGYKPSDIFADYRVNAEEGKDRVTCLLQFYEGGPRGASLLLDNPAGIKVDGETLVADSTLRTGAYYELQKPLEGFSGTHTFTLTDEHGQTYEEKVPFEPLVLQTALGETVKGDSLVLQVSGLLPGEKLRVVLIDMDFDTDDINKVQSAPEGKIVLTREDLRQVAAGPVTLMLYKELERDLKNGTAAGGQLSITYGLTREFELVK